ncbi:hypothetical protein [Streptomyces sp. NPDC005438]|uniref:hypothetical protein n=1 Tax=Streptomyces sp. NPDC005438 TaxID=3156880 RepID=UPI0033A46E67
MERWTLGPEPYAVPLPAEQPEAADSGVLPLPDGRVLVCRRFSDRQELVLLYPSGSRIAQVDVGAVPGDGLELLAGPPTGNRAYGLIPGRKSSTLWSLVGDERGPCLLAEIPGWCSGGVWLDHEGRMLALDQSLPGDPGGQRDGDADPGDDSPARRLSSVPDGPTKTVVVDLGNGGAVSPLLQLSEHSEDRLLVADPDSGLLLARSDAAGEPRLCWGVLGGERPLRFCRTLSPQGVRLTPFAIQPGQVLTPEQCVVALRVDAERDQESPESENADLAVRRNVTAHRGDTWLALWRPTEQGLRHMPAPAGWFVGQGTLSPDGELRLPYSSPQNPCGLARLATGTVRLESAPRPHPTSDEATSAKAEKSPSTSGEPTGEPQAPAKPPAERTGQPRRRKLTTAPAPGATTPPPGGPARQTSQREVKGPTPVPLARSPLKETEPKAPEG